MKGMAVKAAPASSRLIFRTLSPKERMSLYKIAIRPMHAEKHEYSIEDNCLLHSLRVVLRHYDKKFNQDILTRIKIHIAQNLAMECQSLHLYLNPINIFYSYQTNVSYDQLRFALKKQIPVILIYKDINHKIKNWKAENNLLIENSNHAVVLIGIDNKYLYMLDSVYCHGNVVFKMTINDFSRLWYSDYNDCIPATNYFFQVRREAIFFYNDKPATAVNDKDSVWNSTKNEDFHFKSATLSVQLKKQRKQLTDRIRFAKEHNIKDKGICNVVAKLTYYLNIKNRPSTLKAINKELIREYLKSCNCLIELAYLEDNNFFTTS